MIDILLCLICFSIFVVLQSLMLNGLYECFKGEKLVNELNGFVSYQGMIIYMIAPKFFEKNKYKTWAKMYTCIKCISGWAGTISFWSIVLPVFGFKWIELIVYGFDLFILVALNGFFYKKL